MIKRIHYLKQEKLNIVIAKKLKEKGLNSISISNDQIIGKYICKDVKEKNGEILVGAGFDITEEQLEKIISQELSKIPPDQAEVLRLMYFKNKSGQEVADELNLPLGTVKSRIRLALKKMKVGLRSIKDSEE